MRKENLIIIVYTARGIDPPNANKFISITACGNYWDFMVELDIGDSTRMCAFQNYWSTNASNIICAGVHFETI